MDQSVRNRRKKRTTASQTVYSIWRLVSKADNAIVHFSGSGDNLPQFYCVHSLGGEITLYYQFAKALGLDQRIYGIQVTQQMLHTAPTGSIEFLAAEYVDKLRLLQPEG